MKKYFQIQLKIQVQNIIQKQIKKHLNIGYIVIIFNKYILLQQIKKNIQYYSVGKSFRKYQFDIVQTCLKYNTLVALPTGLGKTFIAATIMFNFYVWFPKGKIFFLAPTRPLVSQQMECLKIFEKINQQDIIEIVGNLPTKKRKEFYQNKRVFFQTPQTLDNDLQEKRYEGDNLCLIVFDEAHKATGKYAYTNIINQLEKLHFGYRVLALSATPGNQFEQIQEVLKNLKICKLEVKDENDEDIKKYMHKKQIFPVKVQNNDQINKIQENISNLIFNCYQWLLQQGVVPFYIKMKVRQPVDIHRGIFYSIFKNFYQKQQIQNDVIEKGGTIGLTEVQNQLQVKKKNIADKNFSSLKNFLKMEQFQPFQKHKIPTKKESKLQKIENIQEIEDVQEIESHPKSQQLIQILVDQFQNEKNVQNFSKSIVFTQNRNSAFQLKKLLNQSSVYIRSEVFIGQANLDGQGMNQKAQIQVIKKFKNNEYNTLIATCIGEEGLDIGEVDVIVCYDSGFSPIRMIQRMGRTGRKREGKVYILLMEGKEYLSYIQSQKRHKALIKLLKINSIEGNFQKGSNKEKFQFYGFNPRMIPVDVNPLCKIIINEQQDLVLQKTTFQNIEEVQENSDLGEF
ncbi:hypothetical protein IMG5_146930, partial [Ichthyophthirius multifiliis]